jgi:hypothetical protein
MLLVIIVDLTGALCSSASSPFFLLSVNNRHSRFRLRLLMALSILIIDSSSSSPSLLITLPLCGTSRLSSSYHCCCQRGLNSMSRPSVVGTPAMGFIFTPPSFLLLLFSLAVDCSWLYVLLSTLIVDSSCSSPEHLAPSW